MFTVFTCIPLPYILYIIYLSLGGPLDGGYVIIIREGLLAVGGVNIVVYYLICVSSETNIVK